MVFLDEFSCTIFSFAGNRRNIPYWASCWQISKRHKKDFFERLYLWWVTSSIARVVQFNSINICLTFSRNIMWSTITFHSIKLIDPAEESPHFRHIANLQPAAEYGFVLMTRNITGNRAICMRLHVNVASTSALQQTHLQNRWHNSARDLNNRWASVRRTCWRWLEEIWIAWLHVALKKADVWGVDFFLDGLRNEEFVSWSIHHFFFRKIINWSVRLLWYLTDSSFILVSTVYLRYFCYTLRLNLKEFSSRLTML